MKIDIKIGEQYDIFYYIDNPEDKKKPEINISVENDEEYNYKKPKQEADVPEEYIKYILKMGTGYEDGKFRVKEYIEDYSKKDAIKHIQKEYGVGGCGWPIKGYGVHGYDTVGVTKGIKVLWRDEEGEKEGVISWNVVYKNLKELIETYEYITLLDEERRKFNKLCRYLDKKYGYRKDWGELPNKLYCKGLCRLKVVKQIIKEADEEAA